MSSKKTEESTSTAKGKVKRILKELFATRYGWLSLLLSNLLWSMFWLPFLVLWFMTKDNQFLVIATSVYVFFAQPLIPMWLVIPTTAYYILKRVLKK